VSQASQHVAIFWSSHSLTTLLNSPFVLASCPQLCYFHQSAFFTFPFVRECLTKQRLCNFRKSFECHLQIVADCDREDNIRQLALEAIVTLAETAPGLIRKQKTMITHISEFVVKMVERLCCARGCLSYTALIRLWRHKAVSSQTFVGKE